jgi:hypothetical protein
MHARLQPAILGGALAALLVLPRTTAAHFVLIYPEADDDRPVLNADAEWLRPPATVRPGDGPSSKTKKAGPSLRGSGKSEARVAPLKRQLPKRETDPSKARRPALGW